MELVSAGATPTGKIIRMGESKGGKATQNPIHRSARSCPGEEVSADMEGERVRCA